MQDDRNYYRLLTDKELIELAKSGSELAVVLAERLAEVLDELKGPCDCGNDD
jgi:hypothetical protein